MNKKKLKTHLAAEKLSNNKNQKLATWCGKSSEIVTNKIENVTCDSCMKSYKAYHFLK